MLDKYIGIKYQSRPTLEIEILSKYNDKFYQVKEVDLITGSIETTTLLTEDQIENDLNNQEFIIEKNKKAIEYNKKMEIESEIERQKEIAIQLEYENVYGYCNNMSPMQKGKILKTLNIKYHYNNNGINIGYMSRKQFLYNMIKEGYILDHKTNTRYYTKNSEPKIKANDYRLVDPEGTFYELTKTEFDYTSYLINNIFNKLEV